MKKMYVLLYIISITIPFWSYTSNNIIIEFASNNRIEVPKEPLKYIESIKILREEMVADVINLAMTLEDWNSYIQPFITANILSPQTPDNAVLEATKKIIDSRNYGTTELGSLISLADQFEIPRILEPAIEVAQDQMRKTVYTKIIYAIKSISLPLTEQPIPEESYNPFKIKQLAIYNKVMRPFFEKVYILLNDRTIMEAPSAIRPNERKNAFTYWLGTFNTEEIKQFHDYVLSSKLYKDLLSENQKSVLDTMKFNKYTFTPHEITATFTEIKKDNVQKFKNCIIDIDISLETWNSYTNNNKVFEDNFFKNDNVKKIVKEIKSEKELGKLINFSKTIGFRLLTEKAETPAIKWLLDPNKLNGRIDAAKKLGPGETYNPFGVDKKSQAEFLRIFCRYFTHHYDPKLVLHKKLLFDQTYLKEYKIKQINVIYDPFTQVGIDFQENSFNMFDVIHKKFKSESFMTPITDKLLTNNNHLYLSFSNQNVVKIYNTKSFDTIRHLNFPSEIFSISSNSSSHFIFLEGNTIKLISPENLASIDVGTMQYTRFDVENSHILAATSNNEKKVYIYHRNEHILYTYDLTKRDREPEKIHLAPYSKNYIRDLYIFNNDQNIAILYSPVPGGCIIDNLNWELAIYDLKSNKLIQEVVIDGGIVCDKAQYNTKMYYDSKNNKLLCFLESSVYSLNIEKQTLLNEKSMKDALLRIDFLRTKKPATTLSPTIKSIQLSVKDNAVLIEETNIPRPKEIFPPAFSKDIPDKNKSYMQTLTNTWKKKLALLGSFLGLSGATWYFWPTIKAWFKKES